MRKIMFICTGNICRSAMAEYILKNKLEKLGLNVKAKIYSSGIYAYDGDIPTYEALSVLKNEYGIDMSSHKATPIRDSKIEEMDLILCMTNSHRNTINMIYPNMASSVYVLKDYVGIKGEISDPYGYGIDVYSNCAKEISECLDLLIKKEFGRD